MNLLSARRCPYCSGPTTQDTEFVKGPQGGNGSYNQLCVICHREFYVNIVGAMFEMPARINRISEVYGQEIHDEDRKRAEENPPPVEEKPEPKPSIEIEETPPSLDNDVSRPGLFNKLKKWWKETYGDSQ